MQLMLRYSFLHKTVLAVCGLVLNFYVIYAEPEVTAEPLNIIRAAAPHQETKCLFTGRPDFDFRRRKAFSLCHSIKTGLTARTASCAMVPKDHSTDINRLQHHS
jgi:hypothetical protein